MSVIAIATLSHDSSLWLSHSQQLGNKCITFSAATIKCITKPETHYFIITNLWPDEKFNFNNIFTIVRILHFLKFQFSNCFTKTEKVILKYYITKQNLNNRNEQNLKMFLIKYIYFKNYSFYKPKFLGRNVALFAHLYFCGNHFYYFLIVKFKTSAY